MPGRKMPIVTGEIYHVFNRGNNKENIYFCDQDYRAFLFRLALSMGFEADKLQKEKIIFLPYS